VKLDWRKKWHKYDGKNKNPDPNSLGFFTNKRYPQVALSLLPNIFLTAEQQKL